MTKTLAAWHYLAAREMWKWRSCSGSSFATTIYTGYGRTLYRSTIAELADELGTPGLPNLEMIYDVTVVGAGPLGPAAAEYAASEGIPLAAVHTVQ